MTAPAPRSVPGDIMLDPHEARFVRDALIDCSRLLTWVEENAGDDRAARLIRDAFCALTSDSITPGHVLCNINLAVDYLDFARHHGTRR